MGVALAALTTGAIAELYGWRWAFIIPGIVAIGVGLLYGLHLAKAKVAAEAKAKKAPPAIPVSLQKRAFIFLIIAPMFGGLIFQATTISLPKIMDERLAGLFPGTAEIGLITALVFACAAVAQLIVGELLDRFPTKRIYLGLVALQIAFCALAIPAVGWGSVAVTLPLMLVTFGLIPVNDWIVAHFISKEYRSRVYAVKSVLVLGIGAVAVQMSGRLHDMTGNFDTLFMVLVSSAVVVLFATALILPTRRQIESAQPAAAE